MHLLGLSILKICIFASHLDIETFADKTVLQICDTIFTLKNKFFHWKWKSAINFQTAQKQPPESILQKQYSLKITKNSQENNCVGVCFSIKLQASGVQVFSCKFWEVLKNFLIDHERWLLLTSAKIGLQYIVTATGLEPRTT